MNWLTKTTIIKAFENERKQSTQNKELLSEYNEISNENEALLQSVKEFELKCNECSEEMKQMSKDSNIAKYWRT